MSSSLVVTFHFGFESSFYSKNVTPSGATVPSELLSDHAQLMVVDFEEVYTEMITANWSMKFLGGMVEFHHSI